MAPKENATVKLGVEYELVDGFLCKHRRNLVSIVDPLHTTLSDNQKRILTKDYKPISVYGLFDQYKDTSVIPCTSKLIFEKCKKKKSHFRVIKPGQYEYVTKTKYNKIKHECVTFEAVTICKQKKTKFLVFKEGVCDELVQIPKFNRIVIPKHTTTFYEEALHINGFQLSQEDIKLLANYDAMRTSYEKEAEMTFKMFYDVVQDKYHNVTFVKTYVSNDVKFPKTYKDDTLVTLSKQLAFLMYVVDLISDLSFGKEIGLRDQMGIISPEFVPQDLCRRFSGLIRNMMKDTKSFELMSVILKLNTFIWKADSVERLKVRTISSYRATMDSLKAVITYAVLYGDVMPQPGYTTMGNIFFDSSCEQWNGVKTLYTKVIKETHSTKSRCRPYAPDGFMVDGEIFSRRYVQGFYQDMLGVFNGAITRLEKYFLGIPTIDEVRKYLLDNHLIDLREVRNENCNSILNLFDTGDRVKIHPFLKDTAVLDESAKKEIFNQVNDISKAIMWMIYFASGGPYRYTELAILKFAGNERSIFFNSTSRCIEIDTTYSKSKVRQLVCKVLDSNTSAYVLYYITAVRYMLRVTLGSDYEQISRGLVSKQAIIDKEYDNKEIKMLRRYKVVDEGAQLSDKEFSDQVLHSFMFVNPITGCLLSRESFLSFLKRFPSNQTIRSASFRVLRSGMVGMLREYINFDRNFAATIEESAGHNVETGFSEYATNPYSYKPSLENYTAEHVSLLWHRWLGLDHFHLTRTFQAVEYQQVMARGEFVHRTSHIKNVNIGFQNCKSLLPEEEENSDKFVLSMKELFTQYDIYMSEENLVLVDSNPRLDGGHFYLGPIRATYSYNPNINQISFIFLKNEIELANVAKNLQKFGCTSIGLLSTLFNDNNKAIEESSFEYKVYFGTADNLKGPDIWRLLHDWYGRMKIVRLGFVVFHNIDFDNIPEPEDKFNFHGAHKVIIANDKRGANGFEDTLRLLGSDRIPTYDEEVTGRLYAPIIRTETGFPLQNVYKDVYKLNQDTQSIGMTPIIFIREFLKQYPHQKLICLCGSVGEGNFIGTSVGVPFCVMGKSMSVMEKVSMTDRVNQDPNMRLLFANYECVNDIKLEMVVGVLILDYIPSIGYFCDAAKNIELEGFCCVMHSYRSQQDDKPMTNDCIKSQLYRHYDYRSRNINCNCCSQFESANVKDKYMAILSALENST